MVSSAFRAQLMASCFSQRLGTIPDSVTTPSCTETFTRAPTTSSPSAASDENPQWALGLEAEHLMNRRMDKALLDTEMTVVRDEFERGENSLQSSRSGSSRLPTCGPTTASPSLAPAPTSSECGAGPSGRGSARGTQTTVPVVASRPSARGGRVLAGLLVAPASTHRHFAQ